MRAIVTNQDGGPEVLAFEEVETPTPGEGEILVKTVAAGVNRADLLQRQGHYPPPKGVSEVIGLEISGHVAEIGPGVDGWSTGEPCVCLLAGGGYAEYVVVPAGQVVPPPPDVDLVDAAAVIEVAATVVSNVADLLHDGTRFLVHGGTGGIGSFAIPFAKAKGAWVATTAGTKDKLEQCRGVGADLAIDYHDDWVAALKAETDRHGADVILDIMGAKYLSSNQQAMAVGGHLVVIGLQGGRKGELDLSILLNKRGTVAATSLRFRPADQKAAICRRVVEEVWPLYHDGQIPLPPIARVPLAEASRAHELLESGASVGKIVLVA